MNTAAGIVQGISESGTSQHLQCLSPLLCLHPGCMCVFVFVHNMRSYVRQQHQGTSWDDSAPDLSEQL